MSPSGWNKDRLLSEWPQALEFAQAQLLSSSTNIRVPFLREELFTLAKNEDLDLSKILDIFHLLTLTYTRYADSASREAVEAVGMELVRRDECRGTDQGPADEMKLGVAEQILGWLSNEVTRLSQRGSSSSYAPADIFVLLNWSCGLYSVCLATNPTFVESNAWPMLVTTMARLFDMIQDSTQAKASLKSGGLMRVRRVLRSADRKLPTLIASLLAASKNGQTPLRFIPLAGVSVSVLIRLKTVPEPTKLALGRSQNFDLLTRVQNQLLNLYLTAVVMSKSTVPAHVLTSFDDLIQTYVSPNDLTNTILPTIERGLLRSPEYALEVTSHFFRAYDHPLDSDSFRRVMVQAVNSTKSTNAVVRAHAIDLFKTILKDADSGVQPAVDEILALPKTGKTVGPDHRVALYTMLGYIPCSQSVSPSIVQTAVPLLAKETHEGAIAALSAALPSHIVLLFQSNKSLSTETISLIAKEMTSSKLPTRRAFCALTGNSLWGESVVTDAALSFAKSILVSLENNLKTVSTNPLNASPVDGYIALAVLLGPIAGSKAFDDVLSRNIVIQAIPTSTVKPSFLIWDKVYQKISEPDDQRWLLRACDVALQFFAQDVAKSRTLGNQLGLILVYLAVNGATPEVRRSVYSVVESHTRHNPGTANKVIREAVTSFLTHPIQSKTSEEETRWNKHPRLSALLLSSVSFDEGTSDSIREEVVVSLSILAHHENICANSRQLWIDLCQKASIDPHKLVNQHMDSLIALVLEASLDLKAGFPEAAHKTVSVLAFVSPETVVPRLLEQIKVDMSSSILNAITDTDISIWMTPEGTTFVDVLTSTKGDVQRKGKNSEIEKWEADLRQSLANKKPSGSMTLNKQQQAVFQAQLEKESQVRRHVTTVKQHLERGLQLIRSLVTANVPEFRDQLSLVLTLLFDASADRGAVLSGPLVFETYLILSQCCSERLDTFRKWAGVAALRSSRPSIVPEELSAEPLGLLILRVLHRLRFQSEQSPFDPATFSYTFPLLRFVLFEGGVASEDPEESLEQVAVALDIIKFHVGEFSGGAFPRSQTLESLVHVIRQQPRLSKEASSTLVDLGQAIVAVATRSDIDVLLHGTLLQEVYVRNSCLQALQPFDLTDLDWSPELLIASHDADEQNARLASHVWDDNGLDIPEQYLDELTPYLGHANAYVRSSISAAIADAVEHWPETAEGTVNALQAEYRDKAKILAPEYDQYGMVIAQSLDRSDPWTTRVAIARSFELLVPLLPSSEVVPFFKFLIEDQALGDRTPDVRKGMLSAGTVSIDLHGAAHLADLISMFEEHLGSSSPATDAGDQIKEAVVILFGRLARHLHNSDPRIPTIVERLVEALKTPAEQVQIAVSECLSPLVKVMRPTLGALVDNLFDTLFTSPKYAARRGSAYGLAGVLKGTGIAGFKEFNVISRLKAAAEEKGQYEPRQGAMFAFETLSHTLGRLFEPYITYVLPLLLGCFGDAAVDVRDATQDAARVIMSNMSGYGVKLIMPSLLSGLDEKQWRTKKGSIELLGMMAYCSPRQLSVSLPIVIPRLTGVLTDSHTQVRTAANKSLKQFGEVISNPEIQSLVPVLLKALVDPAKTPNALSSLLKTSFMHYIDHSSLALVIPILQRGLRERGADTKKKAAQIVGNLASLTDSKDFVPYLSELLPLVHVVLVDPVPEARATAAKALGTLVERLGEVHFPDLVPGLLRTLKTDTSGVDRQGAAQGLSEVLSGLGMERLEGLLPDILVNAQSPRPTVREGFMSLLVFLPATFGTRFQPHLPKIIAPILGGLSDSEEYVREAAMRAGRMVITNYSNKAIDLLLPELEHGMFDPGWRIRHSSITLVGELLFKVSGISGKTSDLEEEDVAAEATTAETSRRALVDVLGVERRDRLLASLYLVRGDGVAVVRTLSLQIWKALVHNTPRTVREVLPELMSQIVVLIAKDDMQSQGTAATCVGELSRKFGEKIVGEMMIILRDKMASSEPNVRKGVCLTLGEIMENTNDAQREDHEDEIISMVRVSLVDDEADVRAAAAQTFDILQETIGTKAIDQTIPTLLEALPPANTVFPVLIPTLTALPMTALSKRLTVILGALVRVIEEDKNEELLVAADEALRALLASISDNEGLNTTMMPKRRISGLNFFAIFCAESDKVDASLYRVDWIRQLISSLDDSNVAVHTSAWNSLDIFVKSLPKDELEPLVVPLRRSIESTGAPGIYVPGFGLPKGVSPTVPIIIAGLTTGSNEQREQAAYAIGDLVERTEESAIKPFVVPFTGPLIRVATQAATYPPSVKTAILVALTTMLERIPTFVKPFFPQLQRTFVKSASDPASVIVRTKAALALGALMKNQPRVDPVITELITGARSQDENIASSLVLALANVIGSADEHVGEQAREACIELVTEALRHHHEENYLRSIARLTVSLSARPEILRPLVQNYMIAGTPLTIASSVIVLTLLAPDEDVSVIDESNVFSKLGLLKSVAQKVIESAGCDRPSVAKPAREARDMLRGMESDDLTGLF
ncbi:armadillo-type protein [Mycena floridula]|nr:armadillo-type protein [Mycena floridula]